jgi:hypothetical protein
MNEDGVWQELLRKKYIHSKSLAEVKVKPLDSPFSRGLMKVKEDFLSRGSFTVGNGEGTRFWEDVWLGKNPWQNNIRHCLTLYNGNKFMLPIF